MSDIFAAKAAKWDANPVRAAMGQAFYAQVVENATNFLGCGLAGSTVLEFGCGTGVLGLHLAQDHAARLHFVDTSPAMLDVLRGKLSQVELPQVQVHQGNLHELSIPLASVDLAVSLMALHHVEDVPGALAGLRRLLKPGGLLLLGDLLPEDGAFHGEEAAAHNGFDPEELRGQCQSQGYLVQRLLPFHLLRKADATGALREYPLFFLAASAR